MLSHSYYLRLVLELGLLLLRGSAIGTPKDLYKSSKHTTYIVDKIGFMLIIEVL